MNIKFFFQAILLKIRINIFGKVVFNDIYGLKYYLWKNTRPIGTLQKGVRTDDTTLIDIAEKVIIHLKKTKGRSLTCFDVGGFIGVISLAMLKALDGKGIVHIFEPVRVNFSRISENITLNNHKNVVLNNFAISHKSFIGLQNVTSEAGSEFLQLLSNQSGKIEGDDLAKRDKDLNISYQHLTIVTTLSKYMSEFAIDNLDLLKIDAEWVDHLVLLGLAEKLDKHCVSVILVEYNHGSEGSKNLLRIFDEYGYSVYFMVRNEGKIVSNLSYYPSAAKECLNLLVLSNKLDFESVTAITKDFLIK